MTRQKTPGKSFTPIVGNRAPGRPEGRPIMPLGSRTRWGKIASVAILSGERYYFMVDKHGEVAMMPAMVVENTGGPR